MHQFVVRTIIFSTFTYHFDLLLISTLLEEIGYFLRVTCHELLQLIHLAVGLWLAREDGSRGFFQYFSVLFKVLQLRFHLLNFLHLLIDEGHFFFNFFFNRVENCGFALPPLFGNLLNVIVYLQSTLRKLLFDPLLPKMCREFIQLPDEAVTA